MKRKCGLIILVIALCLVGCGVQLGNIASMANPWTESDENGVLSATGFDLIAPEGATDVHYSYMQETRMAQLTYSLDSASWVYRVQEANSLEDISGMNYEWKYTDNGTVSGREAVYMAWSDAPENAEYIDSTQSVQVVNWYDVVPGVTYSLSASGTDLNGMDIQVFAEQLFVPLQGES